MVDRGHVTSVLTSDWLVQVPSGKPTITSAHNTSGTSIYLAWEPPHPATLHGEFLGYTLSYRSAGNIAYIYLVCLNTSILRCQN